MLDFGDYQDGALRLRATTFIDLDAFEPPFIRRHREWVFSATEH